MSPIRELSPALLEKAKSELNEDPGRREQDIKHIKDWLSKQPHLNARTDDQWLLSFLRGCKFSLERTKEKLDMYYTMRTVMPELYDNRDPLLPELQEVMKIGVTLRLPQLDPQGRRVFIVRIGSYDPEKVTLENIFKVNMMTSDITLLEDDETVIGGDVSLIDFTGAKMAHAMAINPSFVKKLVISSQEAYPSRPQGIHFYNTPSFFEAIVNVAKSIMKDKMKNRITMHGDSMESVYKIIPKSILPAEYGGDGGSIADIAEHWKTKIESYRDFFLQDEKHKSDEKKRPGKPKTHADLFGIEGSFRQLNVD